MVVSSGSSRWGQYLRNHSALPAGDLIFCLNSCSLLISAEQLQQKDKQILLLLEEKSKIFQDMADSSVQEDMPGSRLLFRANTEEAPKGEAIMKTAINEGERVRVAHQPHCPADPPAVEASVLEHQLCQGSLFVGGVA